MKLQIAISPCPNDTFIFDALINGKIDTEGMEIEVILEDIQQLNERALRRQADLIKVSAGVIPDIGDHYYVIPSGGAMGFGVGPLVITRPALHDTVSIGKDRTVALPGVNTTAHFLFSMAYPEATQKKFVLFSDIEEEVLHARSDFGVIIHENRFTYLQKGLCLIQDLGEFWEKTTGLPIPLGVIAAKRSLSPDAINTLHRLIQKSLDYALVASADLLPEFVCTHAQEMSVTVMKEHIKLYVNDFSRDMGTQGRRAIQEMLKIQAVTFDRPLVLPEDLFFA